MTTAKPLMHPLTEGRLGLLRNRPPHALLISGPAGIGKTAVARWHAANLLKIPIEKLDSYPYFLEISPIENKAISIDAVRQLEHVTSLKTTGSASISRVIIINDAHLLTTEAQNALLKTLEGPPQDTVLIMTSSQQHALLPTIRSRLQQVEITKPSREALITALPGSSPQSLALSDGLPGLAFALAKNDEQHPLVEAAKTARQLLQQSSFEKLCRVDALSKNKEASRNLVYILMQMAHAALLTGKGSARWQKILRATYNADSALNRGTQPKLVLTNLMLNL